VLTHEVFVNPTTAFIIVIAAWLIVPLMIFFPTALGWILVIAAGISGMTLFSHLLFQALTGKTIAQYLKELE